MKNNNIKKTFRSITASLMAVILIASGTFAWNAFDQEALNKTRGQAKSVGARLHDDFDGTNKDIYIENYAEEGGDLVFARIRLDEYMEVGVGAGTDADDLDVVILRGDIEDDRNNTPIRSDVDTWDTYKYKSTSDGSEQIRKYRDLEFGGSTIYMPTFNKHIYNLEADINGTLEGLDGDMNTEADDFSDYQIYANGQSMTSDAKYAQEDNLDPDVFTTVRETHVAKPTLTSTVMSMQEWMDNGSIPGHFWVYDEDGWAYWAQGIEAQTATGLLLTGITEVDSPNDEWYYAVNVVSQLATANDWGTDEVDDGFYEDGITTNAEKLLQQIAGLIDGVSIDANIKEGNVDLQIGDTIEVAATVTVPSEYEKQDGYSWSISEVNGNSNLTQTQIDACFQGGVFTPIAGMIGNSYKLTASADLNYKVKDSILVYVYDTSSVSIEITAEANATEVEYGKPLKLDALVQGISDQSVIWSVINGQGDTSITQNGVLSVDELQPAKSVLTVRAISTLSNKIIGEKTILVTPTFKNVTVGSNVTVLADDIEWYVLKKVTENNQTRMLIFSKGVVGEPHIYYGTSSSSSKNTNWEVSELRRYMNDEFITEYLPTLENKIIPVDQQTVIKTGSSTTEFVYTTDKVFPLVNNDLGWASNPGVNTQPTLTGQLVSKDKVYVGAPYWVRAPYDQEHVYVVVDGKNNARTTNDTCGIRPAMWITID